MQSSWLFLNIDELLYRFHLLLEWVWYFVSLKWIFGDSSAAENLESGQLGVGADAGFFDTFFSSGIFRIFSSRPSQEYDSIQEYINPSADKNLLELLWGIVSGTGDKESIIQILFGTFFGWILLLSILGILLKRYLATQIHFMEHEHKLLYDLAQEKYQIGGQNDKAARWQTITTQAQSEDPNQWKIAIIDADILLDEILTEQGFVGSTIGEKLQDAERKDLSTLQFAWQAHQIRNRIAHDGEYVLSQRDCKTAISYFERFFNELYQM